MLGSFGRDDEVMFQTAPWSAAPPFPQHLRAHHTIVGLSLGKITKGALFPQLAHSGAACAELRERKYLTPHTVQTAAGPPESRCGARRGRVRSPHPPEKERVAPLTFSVEPGYHTVLPQLGPGIRSLNFLHSLLLWCDWTQPHDGC